MKDKIFIAWSGSNGEALKVKSILESKFNYVCCIGGNADNSSRYSSVGDTVIQQIKECNQAIVIFQNRADGAVSNNLFFELGYVLAMYGTKKVHCVKRKNEKVVLPSDFDNSFVEPLDDESGENAFADGIVEYFMGRQKMSINDNKMYLINNRYLMHDKLMAHYSESGSKCSDYELAQYVLFYMQAAHMFGDVKKIQKEIEEFKQKHNFEFSPELSLAVNLCLSFFELLLGIKSGGENSEVYIDKNTYWEFRSDYMHYLKQIVPDDLGIFDEWAEVFIYDHLNFASMLFANNETLPAEMRQKLYGACAEYALRCLDSIAVLEKAAPCKENNDEIGLISLLRAYIYRNLFVAKQQLGEREEAEKWLGLTLKERSSLKNNFGKGTIDTQLYNNFRMEYYLALVDYLSYMQDVDEFEVDMYRSEMVDYLHSVRNDDSENVYLKQIAYWCDKR